MKKTITMLLLIFCSKHYGQQISIKMLKELQLDHPRESGYIEEWDEKNIFYSIPYAVGKKNTLAKLDFQGNILEEIDFKPKDIVKGFVSNGVYYFNGRAMILGYVPDNSEKKVTFYSAKISKNELIFEETQKIYECESKSFKFPDYTYDFMSLEGRASFNIEKSGSIIYIQNSDFQNGLKEDPIRTIAAFNYNFEKLFEFKLTPSKKSKISKLLSHTMDKTGKSLCLFDGNNNYGDLKNKKNNRTYIQAYNHSNLLFETDLQSSTYNFIKTKIHQEGSVSLVAGLYSKKSDKDDFPIGFFVYTFDSTGKKVNELLTPFTDEYNKHLKEKYNWTTALIHDNYSIGLKIDIQKIITDVNNSSYIVFEESENYTTGSQIITSHTFLGTKMVVKVNSLGKLEWQTLIPSWMDFPAYMSNVRVLKSGNKLALVYTERNEIADNDNFKDFSKPKNYEPYAICVAEIDITNGTYKKSKYTDPSMQDGYYFINSGFTRENQFLFTTKRRIDAKTTGVKISMMEYK